jgi:hypothetical protein
VVQIHSPRPIFSIRYLLFEIREKATVGDFVGGEIHKIQQTILPGSFGWEVPWILGGLLKLVTNILQPSVAKSFATNEWFPQPWFW